MNQAINPNRSPASSILVWLPFLTVTGITCYWSFHAPEPLPGFVRFALYSLAAASALSIRYAAGMTGSAGGGETGCVFTDRETLWMLYMFTVSGFLVRMLWLESVPSGCWLDEAHHGLDAVRMLESRDWPVFFPANTGREPIHIWMVAVSVEWLGRTITALRLPSVLAGTLLIPAVFFAAKHLAGRDAALIAAGFTAFARWHVTFSRISFRSILVPLVTALFTGVVAAHWKSRPRTCAVSAGLILGLGFYTAIPFRIFPVAALALLWLKRKEHAFAKTLQSWILVWMAASCIAAPLGVYFFHHPDMMTARIQTTSLLNDISLENIKTILINLMQLMESFHYRGDEILRHNLCAHPMTDPLTGTFLIIGLACINFRNGTGKFLPLWLIISLIPAAVSVTWTGPHALRSIGAISPLTILAGTGFLQILKTFPAKRTRRVLVMTVIGFVSVWNLVLYFGFYNRMVSSAGVADDAVWGFNTRETRLAQWINSRKDDLPEIWLSPQLYLHPTLQFLKDPDLVSNLIRTPGFERTDGDPCLCILDYNPRNIFWLRNSDLKRFFDFWIYHEAIDAEAIDNAIRTCYIERTGLIGTGDNLIHFSLTENFPGITPDRVAGFELWHIPGSGPGRTSRP